MSRPAATASDPKRPGPRPTPVQRLVHARGHYPVWSVKSIAWLALLTVGLTATAAFVSGKRSPLVELEWTLGVVSAALFTFLAIGLYRGARLRETEAPSADVKGPDWDDWTPDGTSLPDISCPLDGFDGGDEGCLGALAGFLLSIVVLVLLIGLLWVFVQVGVLVLVVVMTGIYWVLHLALRQVFAHSDACRGNLVRSMAFASLYTVLYTGWMFALLFGATALQVT